MQSDAEELIRRIHDKVNRSVADRSDKGAVIYVWLRKELEALRSKIRKKNGGVMEEGGEHVVFGDNGPSMQVRR